MRRAAAAVALFALTVPLLWRGGADGDVVELHRYGDAVLHGALPYRDFGLEYPPGAIPLFTLPALGGDYLTVFRLEAALGWALVIVLVAALRPRHPALLAAVALTPLALGAFALERIDAWATALALGALLALLRGRAATAGALLAAGVLVKVWPLVLLPLVVLRHVSRRALVAAVAVLAAGLVPFVVLAPGGSYNAVVGQVHRPLEHESLAAAALLALGRPVRFFFDSGSWNVASPGAHALASLSGLAQLAGVALAVWLFRRSPRTSRDLLAAAAVAVAAVAAFGKVLSPQYLLWIGPFAALVDVAATCAFLAASVAQHLLHTLWFGRVLDHDAGAIALLAARDALLVATFALLARRAAAA